MAAAASLTPMERAGQDPAHRRHISAVEGVAHVLRVLIQWLKIVSGEHHHLPWLQARVQARRGHRLDIHRCSIDHQKAGYEWPSTLHDQLVGGSVRRGLETVCPRCYAWVCELLTHHRRCPEGADRRTLAKRYRASIKVTTSDAGIRSGLLKAPDCMGQADFVRQLSRDGMLVLGTFSMWDIMKREGDGPVHVTYDLSALFNAMRFARKMFPDGPLLDLANRGREIRNLTSHDNSATMSVPDHAAVFRVLRELLTRIDALSVRDGSTYFPRARQAMSELMEWKNTNFHIVDGLPVLATRASSGSVAGTPGDLVVRNRTGQSVDVYLFSMADNVCVIKLDQGFVRLGRGQEHCFPSAAFSASHTQVWLKFCRAGGSLFHDQLGATAVARQRVAVNSVELPDLALRRGPGDGAFVFKHECASGAPVDVYAYSLDDPHCVKPVAVLRDVRPHSETTLPPAVEGHRAIWLCLFESGPCPFRAALGKALCGCEGGARVVWRDCRLQ